MTDALPSLRAYLGRCCSVLGALPAAGAEALANDLSEAYDAGRFVFLCGNGGSGSNASHICEDFGKSTLNVADFDRDDVRRLRILSLTDNTAYILAWANDEGFERVFVEQLKNLASPGDRLIAFSGSGNSPNVLRATSWANAHGLHTWGVTGFGGGQLRRLAQGSLHIPLNDMGMVESIHLLVFHWILEAVHAHIHRVAVPVGSTQIPEGELSMT